MEKFVKNIPVIGGGILLLCIIGVGIGFLDLV